MAPRTPFLALVTALALILTACGGGAGGPNLQDPFIGGNIALNAYFQNGVPPPTVYDGGKFPFGVGVVIENVGEADIGPGTDNPYMTARIEGINPTNFGVTDAAMYQVLSETVNGAQKNFDGTIQPGWIANFIFEDLNYQGRLQGNDLFTIRTTLCYDYENFATMQVCFKDDIIENVQDSTLCTLTGPRQVATSGGPIHVESAIQNPLSRNKVQVNFVVGHVGPGEFYGRDATEDCNPSVRNTNKYKVDVEILSQDPGTIIQCTRLGNSNRGVVSLYGGSPQTITCSVTGGSPESRVYTDTLTVRTRYRYGQFLEQPIVIQAVPSD